jgi:hypothetical protein
LGGTRGRYHQWDLRNTADLRQFVPCIKDGRRKAIVESVITAFEAAKVVLDGSLTRGAIHGDFNDANLILTDAGEMGLIDFGDVVNSWTVNEIAIGAAYATVSSHGQVRWVRRFTRPSLAPKTQALLGRGPVSYHSPSTICGPWPCPPALWVLLRACATATPSARDGACRNGSRKFHQMKRPSCRWLGPDNRSVCQ